MTDDDGLAELDRVQEFLAPRLDRAERLYTQALNGLWLGNASGAGVALTLTGVTLQSGTFHHWLMVPLCFFLFGLMSMGLGSVVFLMKEARIIKRIELMRSVRDIMKLQMDEITSQSEEAGLVWNWRNYAAIVSAGAFVLGIISGLLIIFVHLK